MRPVRLELHGFTAFREEVVIDFAGAELFALSGPTGAGKSSIIDGMCFALYGSVPRLDRRTVAPVISTGKVEARIRFDFTIGERAFTAVRVVRRTATGATTKEARLESDGQTLAGDADAVSAKAEELLGLGFEQFTKSVVLPQGDFARFLHDKPSVRQELLVKLLELGVYERMRGEANSRKVAADASIDVTQRQLQTLNDATPEAVAAAAGRVELLTALRSEIDEAQPHIDELLQRRVTFSAAADEAEKAVTALADVRTPDDVAELSELVVAAEKAVAAATAALTEASAAVDVAQTQREALGDATVLQRLLDAHQQRDAVAERVTNGTPKVAEAEQAEQAAAERLRVAEQQSAAAGEALEAAKRNHAAHAVAATLVAGEDCPVCLQQVATVPKRAAPAALSQAEAAASTATRALRTAQQAVGPLQEQRAKWQQTLESLTEQLRDIDERLAGAPPLAQVSESLAAITAADAALADARAREAQARAALTQASDAAAKTTTRREEAWSLFAAARDRVAAFGPPAAQRTELAAAWSALGAWAQAEAAGKRAEADEARRSADAAAADLNALQAKLAARCDECAVVVVGSGRARDAVADAIAGADAEHRRLKAGLEQAQRWRLEIAGHAERAEVAKELVTHLSSRGFERWLLDEALGQLAVGASSVLRELSAGQYSLALDAQNNFVVIDHRSADEQRPARTLSGGETFLASLSLALTLAEHLTQLAVGSEPRLESIFLDEGFGTLDPETLDVVAAAIEELQARGRTVGIVTHVRDLAERMPVRYDVRKAPTGSTVERVER